MADATWLALNVVSGGGSFSSSQPIGVTKIAKSVIAPLADQNISVFMLSTYQTDFILVSRSPMPQGLGHCGCPLRHVLQSSVAPVPCSVQREVKGTSGSSVWLWLGSRSLPSPTRHLPFTWAILGWTWRPGGEGWGPVWVECPPS